METLHRLELALIAFLVSGAAVFGTAQFSWRWCVYAPGPAFGVGTGLLLVEITNQRLKRKVIDVERDPMEQEAGE